MGAAGNKKPKKPNKKKGPSYQKEDEQETNDFKKKK
jgi:hypothetical protein